MKKIIIVGILFIFITACPSYAINVFEKVLYKRDVIKAYNSKILVNPLTNEIKYIWQRTSDKNGYWAPIFGIMKGQFQAIYDEQNKKK